MANLELVCDESVYPIQEALPGLEHAPVVNYAGQAALMLVELSADVDNQ